MIVVKVLMVYLLVQKSTAIMTIAHARISMSSANIFTARSSDAAVDMPNITNFLDAHRGHVTLNYRTHVFTVCQTRPTKHIIIIIVISSQSNLT